MTKGQYPTITTGLGNLTPSLWRRLMEMLYKFEQKNKDERLDSSKDTKPFLARIDKAKCITANRYEYAWTEVQLQNDNSITVVTGGRTSTGANDEWDLIDPHTKKSVRTVSARNLWLKILDSRVATGEP